MHTGHNGHEVSIRFFHGGIAGVTGRPTMGSWLIYGLGSESQNLPAYMVLSDPGGPSGRRHAQLVERLHAADVSGDRAPAAGAADPQPRPAAASSQASCSSRTSRSSTGSIAGTCEQHPGESDLETRIQSYELAAAMQTAAKEALDVSNEPASHQDALRPRPGRTPASTARAA